MSVTKHNVPKRIVIYPKDVETLTGRKEKTCRTILQKIRRHFEKPEDGLVTIREFCSFMALDEEEVRENLQ